MYDASYRSSLVQCRVEEVVAIALPVLVTLFHSLSPIQVFVDIQGFRIWPARSSCTYETILCNKRHVEIQTQYL